MELHVIEKSYAHEGQEFLAKALKMGEDEYMTVDQAAESLGVAKETIRWATNAHSLMIVGVTKDHLKLLKSQKLVPLKSARANLLPKSTVKALVKILDTPQAWAAYNALWTEVEVVQALRDELAAAADDRLTGMEKLKLLTAIADRSGLFKQPHLIRGIIERDVKWRVFGKAYTRMKVEDLPRGRLQEALDLVASWTRQLSPLSPKQLKNIDAWVSNTISQAKHAKDPGADELSSLLEKFGLGEVEA